MSSFFILNTYLDHTGVLPCDPRFKAWEEEVEFNRKPKMSTQASGVHEPQGLGSRQ